MGVVKILAKNGSSCCTASKGLKTFEIKKSKALRGVTTLKKSSFRATIIYLEMSDLALCVCALLAPAANRIALGLNDVFYYRAEIHVRERERERPKNDVNQ